MSSLVVTNRGLQSEEEAAVDKDFADRISVKYYKNINFRREKLNDEGKVVEIEYFIKPISRSDFNSNASFNSEAAAKLGEWNHIILNKINSINNYFHFNMVRDPKTNTDFKIMKERANKAKKFWESLLDPQHYHTFDKKTPKRPMDGKTSYKQIRWNGDNNTNQGRENYAKSAYNGWTKKGKELFNKDIILGSLSSGEMDAIARVRQQKMDSYLRNSENQKRRDEEIARMKAVVKKENKALKKQRQKAKREAKKFLKGKVDEGRIISREKEKEEYDKRVRAERAKKKERKINQEMSTLFPTDKFVPVVSHEPELKFMKKISPRGSPQEQRFDNELKAKEAWNKLTRSKKKSQGGRRTRKKKKRKRTRKRRKKKRKRTRK